MTKVLMIDNYDSFTYNLVQALRVLGAEVVVHRNDELTPAQAENMAVTHLVISPGPGCPSEAGRSIEFIKHFAGKMPVLGVCLGHQAMAEAFGGKVVRASRLMHGKPSMVQHDGQGVFAALESPLSCGRYHSLTVDEATLPAEFVISARTDIGEVMAMRHRTLPVHGVQFHPESVMTPSGPLMLANFLRLASEVAR